MAIISIGITGGIGSGKTHVCERFEARGFRIYHADARARALMSSDPELMEGVTRLFGKEAYLPDGTLNRPLISSVVFKDRDRLQALNALVHPATGRDFIRWSEEAREGYGKPFLLKEAAILYESSSHLLNQAVITVYAPKHLRLSRVAGRDGLSEAAALARMDKQWPELEKLSRADFVIYNDGRHDLEAQIDEAIRFFS
jgi:dephospho-CoA kinase